LFCKAPSSGSTGEAVVPIWSPTAGAMVAASPFPIRL
jgi:hypothetical protein